MGTGSFRHILPFAVQAAVLRRLADPIPSHDTRLLVSGDAGLGAIAKPAPCLPLTIDNLLKLTKI